MKQNKKLAILLTATVFTTILPVFGQENEELPIEQIQRQSQEPGSEQEEPQQELEPEQKEGHYRLEAETTITRPDILIYAHPGNVATIQGVGEDGKMILHYGGNQIIEIPVEQPLYRISSVYHDSIQRQNGVWGVERMIGKRVFDGSEEWSLEENHKNRNDKSTLFSLKPDFSIKIKDGQSTHFQVTSGLEKSAITAEGITMTPEKWYFRVSNVRNIKTIEVWKEYLSAQYQNNTPVTLLYVLPEAEFVPFEDESLQKELEELNIDEIRYTEGVQPKVVSLPQTTNSVFPFLPENLWQNERELKKLVSAFSGIQIYNAAPDDKFFLESISVLDTGECVLKIARLEENSQVVCMATFSFLDMDFISDKLTEISFLPVEGQTIAATAKINFSHFFIPSKSYSKLTYEDAALHPNCTMQKELVLPEEIPVVEDMDFRIYYNNTVLNGDISKTDTVTAETGKVTSTEKYLSLVPDENTREFSQKLTLNTENGKSSYTTKFITVPKETGKGASKTILFFGDSLLAQDYYTKAVTDLFDNDPMKVTLLGTKGLEGSRHEGRGGWAAYQYCREGMKYGETNPFLKDGKFDFSSYMQKNEYETVDIVFINLGINDINLAGHNSHEEIISYYDEMIRSIQKFNPEVKIVLSMPLIPFAKDSTVTAKNNRLNFTKTLKKEYGQKENIFLLPLYVNIDPFIDYKFETPLPNGALDVTDTSHPGVSGYQRLGETSYQMIKYIQFLEEQ